MARHLAIALFLARASIQTQAQYRVDFLVQMVLALFWVVWNVAPLWLVFEIRPEVAGWTRPQAMLVMSAFLILKAVLEGLITPNLVALVDRIRTGTLSINGGVWYSADVPFGGYKASGIGREMGLAGFEEYLETKAIAEAI